MTCIKNIAVLTSGGDAPGMNAAIRGVVRCASFHGLNTYGIFRGYQGLVDDDIRLLSPRDVSGLVSKGGTFLKSARSMDFKTPVGQEKAYQTLKKYQIDALVVIGGDGSFRGAKAFLANYDFPVVGIPGTIDNDIAGTDYTIGYDSAINIGMEAIDRLKDTADAFERLFIVEVMGRSSGNIALSVSIGGGAEECLIPETPSLIDEICQKLNDGKAKGKSSAIIVVAEGDELGNAYDIGKLIKDKIDYESRVVVLGHVQRGGNPTFYDRYVASKMGAQAVEGLLDGNLGQFTALKNGEFLFEDLLYPSSHKKGIISEDVRLLSMLSV